MNRIVAGISLALVALQQQQPRPIPTFEPMQRELFSAGGAFVNAFADYDGDGDLDLFVGFNGTANRLYRNDGGVFSDVAPAAGIADARATRAAAWGDFDADGDSDLLLGFAPGDPSVLRLYRNDRGRFSDHTAAAGLAVPTGAIRQPSWVDVDADGDLDLLVAFRDRANAFFRNDGGRFRDVAGEMGLADTRKSVGAVWFDYEEDGDLDVYVGNMDGDANGFYRNDKGRFTDVAESVGLAWGGRTPRESSNGTVRPCAADVTEDGRFELFMANYGPNGLFLNRGEGKFEDVSEVSGIAEDSRYDSCAFSDFDHNGRVDLYVNGTVTGGTSYPDHLFLNVGLKFEEVTPANIRALQADHGVQWGDVDGDGDQDLALTGSRPDGMHLVMRNGLTAEVARRSIKVRVVDGRGLATRAGAEVRVYASGTRKLLGTRLVDTGSGYDAQNDMPVHFGLSSASPVDIEVTWPAAGRRVTAKMAKVLPAGQIVIVKI